MVVPLATGASGNDDYQRACGRKESPAKIPILSDRSRASLPAPFLARWSLRVVARTASGDGQASAWTHDLIILRLTQQI
jgi:hypothetical protein